MGYEKVCDLMEAEFEKLPRGVASRKRPAEEQASQEAKKRKVVVPRPNWIAGNNNKAQREYGSRFRGRGGRGRGEEPEASEDAL